MNYIDSDFVQEVAHEIIINNLKFSPLNLRKFVKQLQQLMPFPGVEEKLEGMLERLDSEELRLDQLYQNLTHPHPDEIKKIHEIIKMHLTQEEEKQLKERERKLFEKTNKQRRIAATNLVPPFNPISSSGAKELDLVINVAYLGISLYLQVLEMLIKAGLITLHEARKMSVNHYHSVIQTAIKQGHKQAEISKQQAYMRLYAIPLLRELPEVAKIFEDKENLGKFLYKVEHDVQFENKIRKLSEPISKKASIIANLWQYKKAFEHIYENGTDKNIALDMGFGSGLAKVVEENRELEPIIQKLFIKRYGEKLGFMKEKFAEEMRKKELSFEEKMQMFCLFTQVVGFSDAEKRREFYEQIYEDIAEEINRTSAFVLFHGGQEKEEIIKIVKEVADVDLAGMVYEKDMLQKLERDIREGRIGKDKKENDVEEMKEMKEKMIEMIEMGFEI